MKKQNKPRTNNIAAEYQLPKEAIEAVARSLRLAFIHADEPPADQVIVYPQSIQKDPEEDGWVLATVKIVKDYCGLKSHKVNVRVQVNGKFNCLCKTMQFV